MPKMIHKQKNPFGGEVYTDENFNVIGYGRKDSLGREVFLDKDFRYVGEKRKDLFGGDVYLDKDWKVRGHSQKGPMGETIYTDKDYRYLGRGGSFGGREYVWLNGRSPERQEPYREGKSELAKGIFILVLFIGITIVLWLISK